ncbi:FAD-dependent oxidoreductase [cf. Phormidesmis sp. LEGE 11477]|uniref:GcvT family protein n=1 Tax=cf. Phormidesmis sp. LEGE 11477 TaxID=1828680 RepID=UPI00187EBA94|nr:FAD-dependent oxidoreductase [cf. Phormidesmis sp. LEGE 11477]MBE9059590.1 FAD-dependent oxidoreductase [cf. Phormidesmis sp. LEGE 11477]
MKNDAAVVVIGAGIVGCSTVYHLAQLGWQNIVVVEQGPLFATGGSTSHAPGLVFQTNASKTMTQLAKYTVELYSQLSTAAGPAFYPVGGIEVAYTAARMAELSRKLGWAKSWGIEDACLLTPAEVKEKVSLLDETKVLGGYYVPSDGIAKALRAAEAMATIAIEAGAAEFYGHTTVTDIEVADGQIKAVVTDKGKIATGKVLVCAGIWGPRLGQMVGEVIPLTPVQHQYVQTGPIPELADQTEEVTQPMVRHQDHSMYFRQHGDCWGIGSYQHEPMLLDPDHILPFAKAPVMPSVRSFTEEHFAAAWQSTTELFPALATAELTSKMNGLFSFTPDSGSVVGESARVKGFWVAEAVWVTHGGGVGKVVAELMTTGVPSFDLHEMDIHRFPAVCKSADYILKAGAQQYDEVYDIIHPLDQQTHSRELRVSPFYSRLQALGAQFVFSAGWERPQWFEANGELLSDYDNNYDLSAFPQRDGWEARNWSPIQAVEHLATRDRVALYDLTPFAKFEVTGPGVVSYLQNLCPNDIDKPIGKVIYTTMLDPNGGIMCDLTVNRVAAEKYWVITGGSVHGHDLAWMQKHLPDDGSVQIVDVSASYCCIGLWGPKAPEVLQSVTSIDVSKPAFEFFTSQQFYVGNVPVMASRVSYVGEEGWEIYAPTESGLKLWDVLWAAGQAYGAIAAGMGAFETLRLEKGFLYWGQDIHTEYDPYEAGLGFAVKPNKGDFIGKEALLRRQDYASRKLCFLTLDDSTAVVMGKEPVLAEDGKVLGYATSAGYGYSLGRCIAYAYLPLGFATPGTAVTIEYFGRPLAATVVDKLL